MLLCVVRRTLAGQCVNVHCCRLCVVDKILVGQCVKLMYAASSSTPTLGSVEWCWCLVLLSCVVDGRLVGQCVNVHCRRCLIEHTNPGFC